MITILPIGGLCNRLKVILSFLENNKNLNIYWEKSNDICNQHFLEIFEPNKQLNFLDEKPNEYDFYGFNGKVKNPYLYKIFQPKPEIKLKINYYLNKLGKYFNSCHIRRTDHIEIQNSTKTLINDTVYINFIARSKTKVYLATDNIDTQRKFKDIFGDKIVINEEIIDTENLRKSTLENAYIDLVICSLGQIFQGSSKWSTFTTTIETFKKINYWKNFT
jgi:hypothetical protein